MAFKVDYLQLTLDSPSKQREPDLSAFFFICPIYYYKTTEQIAILQATIKVFVGVGYCYYPSANCKFGVPVGFL